MSASKKPTPQQINTANREAWAKWNAQIAGFERKHPERAKKALERSARAGYVANPELAAAVSYTGAAVESAELLAENSRAASKRKRPKKKPTHRNEVIGVMRKWRIDGSSYAEF